MPKKTDQDKIKKLLLRCPGISNREAGVLCGCSEGTVRNVRAGTEKVCASGLSKDDVDEIRNILAGSLHLKANAGGKIKAEIRKAMLIIEKF